MHRQLQNMHCLVGNKDCCAVTIQKTCLKTTPFIEVIRMGHQQTGDQHHNSNRADVYRLQGLESKHSDVSLGLAKNQD